MRRAFRLVLLTAFVAAPVSCVLDPQPILPEGAPHGSTGSGGTSGVGEPNDDLNNEAGAAGAAGEGGGNEGP